MSSEQMQSELCVLFWNSHQTDWCDYCNFYYVWSQSCLYIWKLCHFR